MLGYLSSGDLFLTIKADDSSDYNDYDSDAFYNIYEWYQYGCAGFFAANGLNAIGATLYDANDTESTITARYNGYITASEVSGGIVREWTDGTRTKAERITDHYLYLADVYFTQKGTYVRHTAYDSNYSLRLYSNCDYILMFISKTNMYSSANTTGNYISIYSNGGKTYNIEYKALGVYHDMYVHFYRIKSDFTGYDDVSIDFKKMTGTAYVYPIYFGRTEYMPTDLKEMSGVPTPVEEEISLVNANVELTKEAIDNQTERLEDTSDANKTETQFSNLMTQSESKNENLFYPITWTTALFNDLANVSPQSSVQLPNIFSNGSWSLDLASFVTQAGLIDFIRLIIQCAITVPMLWSIYNIFFKGEQT